MTQDEIIEMAIQAGLSKGHAHGMPLFLEAFAKLIAAKTIAKLESQEPAAWIDRDGYLYKKTPKDLDERHPPFTALYIHSPQRTEQQEPLIPFRHGCKWCGKTGACEHSEQSPQRTWVGLTAEEIIKAFETSGHKVTIRPQDVFAVTSMVRAIEAKLKQKNGYAKEKNT